MTADANSKSANTMWGGRFAEGPDAIMTAINASIGFDQRLYAQDIAGSRAHAAMLAAQGIITDTDAKAIGEGLLTILSEIERGEFPFTPALEDIHLNIEARLTEIGSARPASACTPGAAATTRWRSTSGFGCATSAMRRSRA
jgi:argininosuccinate lyase